MLTVLTQTPPFGETPPPIAVATYASARQKLCRAPLDDELARNRWIRRMEGSANRPTLRMWRVAGGVAKLVVRGISQDIYASGGRGRQGPAPRHSEQAANAAAARANGQGECEQRRGADGEQRGTPRHPPRAGDGLRTSSRSTRSPGQCERRDRAPPPEPAR